MTRKLVHADVGARIALIRSRLGLKRYEFAERLGVTRATQGNWEMGQMPRADLLDRLARSGGVSVEWLLHGDDSGGKQAVRPRGPKNVLQKKIVNREKPSESYMLADFAPADLRKLPRGYLERYQRRAAILLIRLRRELKQYRTALRLEFRTQNSRSKRSKRRADRSKVCSEGLSPHFRFEC